jgi:prepilin-type N-terminal cleavage/methylation domain-containing protein
VEHRIGAEAVTRVSNRRAFTLVEMLITIGALAIIAVGLASVFDATGKTVTTGRRVSAMNEYAALIEKQLRADFEGMTREGFLVIRNEYANQGTARTAAGDVPLYADALADDPGTRRRRIDELMFFVRRPVTTAREAPVPGMVASGDAARVYYGHAQAAVVDVRNPNTTYRRPEVDDQNDSGALLGEQIPRSPNRYASQWNLVRHLTVLSRPVASNSRTFGEDPGQINLPPYLRTVAADSDLQIALQPAAASIFRRIAGLGANTAGGPSLSPQPLRGNVAPVFASGIVDIATTDLPEIQEVVETVALFPNNIPPNPNIAPLLDGRFGSGSQGLATAEFMRAWMDDAFPANSMSFQPGDRARIRAERSPPDFHSAIDLTTPQRQRAFRRADQLALSSSIFVPSCTEFIVEWSFGVSYPAGHNREGELIWHGLRREVDLDGNGTLNNDEVVARPYAIEPESELRIPIRLRDPQAQISVFPKGFDEHFVTQELIHGPLESGEAIEGPLTSYFGFNDPTFSTQRSGQRAAELSLPWAWPKLIRITMSIADPNDPSFEQVYQFVFETPEADRRGF